MTPRSVVPWLTSLVIVSLSGTLSPFPALAFRPLSHASAAAVPLVRAIELTMGQKSVSDGAISILPFHWGSASSQHRGRQLGGADLARVVHQDADAGRHADPLAVAWRCRPRARWPGSTRRPWPAGPVVELLEPVRVLGVEEVGRRAAALQLDPGREIVLVVVVDPDLDPGRLGERRDQGVGGLLVLRVVERERLAARSRPARSRPCARARRGHEPHEHHRRRRDGEPTTSAPRRSIRPLWHVRSPCRPSFAPRAPRRLVQLRQCNTSRVLASSTRAA